MALINILKEQTHIGFSGRINFLVGDEKRYAGHILMDGGVVVSCRYERATGKPAILMAIAFDHLVGSLTNMVEPEVIANDTKIMAVTVDEIAILAKEYLRKLIRLKKVGFPKDSLFKVNRESLFKDDTDLLGDEYNLATLLWDFKSFSDIINETQMEVERVHVALLGLREKKVLRVKKGSVE